MVNRHHAPILDHHDYALQALYHGTEPGRFSPRLTVAEEVVERVSGVAPPAVRDHQTDVLFRYPALSSANARVRGQYRESIGEYGSPPCLTEPLNARPAPDTETRLARYSASYLIPGFLSRIFGSGLPFACSRLAMRPQQR